jgi:hypothetical protein
MALFGSGHHADTSCRLQVITLDHVIDGTTEISGRNLTYYTLLTDATVRSANPSARPVPSGSTLAIGEDTSAIIAVVPLDDAAHEELLKRATTGKHELPVAVFTGPYVVRGTVLGFDDDPKVLVQASDLAIRDAEIESIAPGSTLGTWQAPLVLLYMHHVQGLVVTA